MKVSDYIAAFVAAQGVQHVYEVIGGMITHLIDSFYARDDIALISMHHEQGAAFAVDGDARISGIPAVAMATSGPGATNLLTGIGSCYFDSVPAVFITGQVNTNELKGDRPIRQLGFQETDIVSIARPITKDVIQITTAEEVVPAFQHAFRLARSGRPGPVLIDVPMNVQSMQIDPGEITEVLPDAPPPVEAQAVRQAIDILCRAERPILLVGSGIRTAGAADLVRALANRTGVPVVNSLLGVDVMPYDNPLRVGMLGAYGNRWANIAVGLSDTIIVLGSRLDIRQTGADTEFFETGRTIVHVDIDAGEVNARVTGCVPVVADVRQFLEALVAAAAGQEFPSYQPWADRLREIRREWPDTDEVRDIEGINPNKLMHDISRFSEQASAFVIDVGQHQMWAAQSMDVGAHQRFLTSGGMGAMGYALPAAIGASLAAGRAPVVVVAGDGGFQLNIQELQTVYRNRLPLKIIILNNGAHGMVRQFQQSYFHDRYRSTVVGYSAPDFTAVAQAYGIPARTVMSEADLFFGLDAMWADPTSPFLLQVPIDVAANVYPKIAFGHPMTEMEPFAKPIAMEGT